jgi:hypothetical protein
LVSRAPVHVPFSPILDFSHWSYSLPSFFIVGNDKNLHT